MVYSVRWSSLLAAMAIAFAGGGVYSFAVYADALKKQFHWSQSSLDHLALGGNIGMLLALSGPFYDCFGPKLTSSIGIFLSFSGYMSIWMAIQGLVPSDVTSMTMYCFLWGQGSAWLDMASVLSSSTSFPESRGRTVGIMKSFAGGSPAILTMVYDVALQRSPANFVLFMATVISSICLFATIYLTGPPGGQAPTVPSASRGTNRRAQSPPDSQTHPWLPARISRFVASLDRSIDLRFRFLYAMIFGIYFLAIFGDALRVALPDLITPTSELYLLLTVLAMFPPLLVLVRPELDVQDMAKPDRGITANSPRKSANLTINDRDVSETTHLVTILETGFERHPGSSSEPGFEDKLHHIDLGTPGPVDDDGDSDKETDELLNTTHPRASSLGPGAARPSEGHLELLAAAQAQLNPLQALGRLNFWLLAAVCSITIGTGLLVINNATQIAESYGAPANLHNVFVSLFTIGSACGRMGVGILSDEFAAYISRPGCLGIVVAGMFIVQTVFSMASGYALLYAGVLLVGGCYGATWVLVPTICVELWGSRHYGTIYAFICTAPIVSTFFLSNFVAAGVYESHIKHDVRSGGLKSSNICYGAECFSWTFTVAALSCFVALCLSFGLYSRTSAIYRVKWDLRRG